MHGKAELRPLLDALTAEFQTHVDAPTPKVPSSRKAALRQPLLEAHITISRRTYTHAKPMLDAHDTT
jgi:hypothetical protein